MSYHSTPATCPQLRKLLREALGEEYLKRFVMSGIQGKPARTKNSFVIKGNKITVFGSDFVAKGFIRD